MHPDQTGKTYVVTGCGTGVGSAVAVELARLGATVIMANRAEDRSEKTRELARKTCPEALERMHHITCDLSDLRVVHSFVDECLKRFPKIDGLINVAGYMDCIVNLLSLLRALKCILQQTSLVTLLFALVFVLLWLLLRVVSLMLEAAASDLITRSDLNLSLMKVL